MSLFRKESDEETKFDFLLNSQQEVRELIAPLQANLERVFAEEIHGIHGSLQGKLTAQTDWLAQALGGLHRDFLNELRSQKAEFVQAVQTLRAENQTQLSLLRSEFSQQNAKISAQNAELGNRLQEHRAEWREALSFELRDETPVALNEWCEQILEEFRAFSDCTGMVRLLAGRLLGHFQGLRLLLTQIEAQQSDFEARIEELSRTLFTPDLGISWNHLTPANSNPGHRRTLRDLETATLDLRAHVKEMLRLKTGIAALEIVPLETRFDARFHESSEFLEVPTEDPTRHNLILTVEKQGYEKTTADGTKVLLQMARVRRSVLKAVLETFAPIAPASEMPAPAAPQELPLETTGNGIKIISDIGVDKPILDPVEARVSGQL